MTFEQAKDQIAKEMNFKDFEGLIQAFRHEQIPYSFLISCMDQAHEITADSVARDAWDRACEAQRNLCAEDMPDRFTTDLVKSTIKPEYQPK